MLCLAIGESKGGRDAWLFNAETPGSPATTAALTGTAALPFDAGRTDGTSSTELLAEAGGDEEAVGVVVLALAEEGRTGLGLALLVLTLFPDNAGVGEA